MYSRVTTKGQVTIPQKIRISLGIRSGDKVEFTEVETGVLIRKITSVSPFEKYEGYLQAKQGEDVDSLIKGMRGK